MPSIRWRISGFRRFRCSSCSSESFLSYQRSLEEGRKSSNCQTLFGMERIPTDNHIRAMLDPVHPSHLQPVFDQVIAALEAHGGKEALGSSRQRYVSRHRI